MMEETVSGSNKGNVGQNVAPGKESAPFESRVMALLIDFALLGCLSVLSAGLMLLLTRPLSPASLQSLPALLVLHGIFLPSWLLFYSGAYFVVLHSCGGQTLGKIFMGIRVVTTAGNGLTMGSSFLRLVGYLVSAVPLGAGFLWTVLDREQASWHDRLAGSRVVAF